MPIIAIVDDEEAIRGGLGTLMRSIDIQPDMFSSADAFIGADLARYACVLSDVHMPGRSGLDLLAYVRAERPQLPVLLMTAFPDERIRDRALKGGADHFLSKPCDPDMIVAWIEGLLSSAGPL